MNDYVEDRLAGRRIYWCPSGEGFLAYCPQPIDPDEYTHCCLQYYFTGADMPSCCRFAFPTGVVIAFFLSLFVMLALMIFFSCWCCICCPLAQKLVENEQIKNAADSN